MNIFFLDSDPKQAAQWYCDRHVIKQILEFAQMMSTTFHLQGIEAPYKKTHENHPSSKWIRESQDNFIWFMEHALFLCEEKISRYGTAHKSQEVLSWGIQNFNKLKLPSTGLTKFAIAISPTMSCRQDPLFNEEDPISCYRLYYKYDKKHLHQWKQNKPNWIQ